MSYKCSLTTSDKQADHKTGTGNEPAAIVTCVSIIVHSEGLVAVLAVAQWSHRDQTGVVFSLGGYHINRRL